MADQDVKAVEGDRRAGGDRRTGTDRRDRRGGEDRRTRESFGGVGHKRGSFLDHPWWVVGTVVFGVLVGMLIMAMTSTPAVPDVPRSGTGGMDVIVKPEN
jgi:hypothetical protein